MWIPMTISFRSRCIFSFIPHTNGLPFAPTWSDLHNLQLALLLPPRPRLHEPPWCWLNRCLRPYDWNQMRGEYIFFFFPHSAQVASVMTILPIRGTFLLFYSLSVFTLLTTLATLRGGRIIIGLDRGPRLLLSPLFGKEAVILQCTSSFICMIQNMSNIQMLT